MLCRNDSYILVGFAKTCNAQLSVIREQPFDAYGWLEDVFGPGLFLHSRRNPVFLFVYNTIRTKEFTLSLI